MAISTAALPQVADSLNNNSDLTWMENEIFLKDAEKIIEILKEKKITIYKKASGFKKLKSFLLIKF